MYRQKGLEKAFFKRAKTAISTSEANKRKIRPQSGPSSADHARRLGYLRGLVTSRQSSLRNLSRDGSSGSGLHQSREAVKVAWEDGGAVRTRGIPLSVSLEDIIARKTKRKEMVSAVMEFFLSLNPKNPELGSFLAVLVFGC